MSQVNKPTATRPDTTTTVAGGATESQSTHPVADKIKNTLHDSIDTLSEKAAATEKSLRASAEKGTENLDKRREQMEREWSSSAVRQYAIDNPVKTAGIAFAAGALLATILRGK